MGRQQSAAHNNNDKEIIAVNSNYTNIDKLLITSKSNSYIKVSGDGDADADAAAAAAAADDDDDDDGDGDVHICGFYSGIPRQQTPSTILRYTTCDILEKHCGLCYLCNEFMGMSAPHQFFGPSSWNNQSRLVSHTTPWPLKSQAKPWGWLRVTTTIAWLQQCSQCSLVSVLLALCPIKTLASTSSAWHVDSTAPK